MSAFSRMPVQVWILTLSAFAMGAAEFVVAGTLTDVAETLRITEGQAGNLVTAATLAIVIGGPLLTLSLARFDQKKVGLMLLFVAGNLVAASTTDHHLLLASRVLAGLTQGPFYGIGAVMATRLVSDKMASRAVSQMFAGLTLANVLAFQAAPGSATPSAGPPRCSWSLGWGRRHGSDHADHRDARRGCPDLGA